MHLLLVDVDEIVDVRIGWKSDTFNKINKKFSKSLGGKISKRSPPFKDEACCFSVIYGKMKKSLDLVAPSADVASMWVHGLNHLLTVIKGLQQGQRFERQVWRNEL